jgi:hypothetical protein
MGGVEMKVLLLVLAGIRGVKLLNTGFGEEL